MRQEGHGTSDRLAVAPVAAAAAAADTGDLRMPYADLLRLRPWERAVALTRLTIPNRLLPENCTVTTRWVALTGTSCAGKTTIINTLELMGHQVVHEGWRRYILAEQRKGLSVEQIRADDHSYRLRVFEHALQEEVHNLRHAHKLIFFDRTTIDSVSTHRASGYEPHEIVHRMLPYRFYKIFHCTPLPFVADGFRTQNEDRRLFIDAAIERDYSAFGYQPEKLGFGTVEQRVAQLLERCS